MSSITPPKYSNELLQDLWTNTKLNGYMGDLREQLCLVSIQSDKYPAALSTDKWTREHQLSSDMSQHATHTDTHACALHQHVLCGACSTGIREVISDKELTTAASS
jgi:hypothetical protein